uniref:hypothetical protein n=1 Tax=Lysinibacillus fusiformis TaxID=28031 RepID=UPI0020BD98F6
FKLIEHNLEKLYSTQKLLQQQWQQLTIQKQALHLLKQQQILQQTLVNYQHIQFPPEGIKRYEQLKDRLLHESQQLMQLKEQYQTVEDQVLT